MIAYTIAFVAHWTLLASVSTWCLWRAGRDQPGVARRRMRLLATALAAITVALFLAASAPDEHSWPNVVTSLLTTATAVLFLVGLAPPAWLRAVWRRPEQERLQLATAELMSATSEHQVAREVLEPMARLVSARALTLSNEDGTPIGSYGDPGLPEDEALRFPIPAGSLVVWPSPYAPYFGSDEILLLRALAGLTGLALDRSRLFEQEREARLVLERADELKSEFVALAAHELRNPVASGSGSRSSSTRRPDGKRKRSRSTSTTRSRQWSTRTRSTGWSRT